MIRTITINSFKRIESAHLELGPINVLVGSNNSGKSCILQGIHFGIALSQARKINGFEQFSPEKLRYCPTDDFLDLHHGRRLTEGPGINFVYQSDSEADPAAQVSLQRGRNGVVKAQYQGGSLLNEISDPKGFFSIYVPGLAGISIREEYRSELVVSNGIARGDANLYLRNVLLRIERNPERKARFDQYLEGVFPGILVRTEFVESNDLWIKSTVRKDSFEPQSLDMVGTGLLQAIQLLAYVSNYAPKLLLLDEPDAHLHPNNQRLLAQALNLISKETDTKIVLATHSRHLLDALSEDKNSRLFWVKGGQSQIQEDWADIAVLMDLGALDKGERFLAGNYKYLVWTEDTDVSFLKTVIEANGISLDDVFVFSYQSSSKFDAAILMAGFIDRIRPGVKIIIHRDRDFMTDSEIDIIKRKYRIGNIPNLEIFITSGSDIESYFVDPKHLAYVTRDEVENERINLESVLQSNMIDFVLAFKNKRDEIKNTLYKTNQDDCPSTSDFISGSQISLERSLGKLMLKKIMPLMQSRGFNASAIRKGSPALVDPEIQRLFNEPRVTE